MLQIKPSNTGSYRVPAAPGKTLRMLTWCSVRLAVQMIDFPSSIQNGRASRGGRAWRVSYRYILRRQSEKTVLKSFQSDDCVTLSYRTLTMWTNRAVRMARPVRLLPTLAKNQRQYWSTSGRLPRGLQPSVGRVFYNETNANGCFIVVRNIVIVNILIQRLWETSLKPQSAPTIKPKKPWLVRWIGALTRPELCRRIGDALAEPSRRLKERRERAKEEEHLSKTELKLISIGLAAFYCAKSVLRWTPVVLSFPVLPLLLATRDETSGEAIRKNTCKHLESCFAFT